MNLLLVSGIVFIFIIIIIVIIGFLTNWFGLVKDELQEESNIIQSSNDNLSVVAEIPFTSQNTSSNTSPIPTTTPTTTTPPGTTTPTVIIPPVTTTPTVIIAPITTTPSSTTPSSTTVKSSIIEKEIKPRQSKYVDGKGDMGINTDLLINKEYIESLKTATLNPLSTIPLPGWYDIQNQGVPNDYCRFTTGQQNIADKRDINAAGFDKGYNDDHNNLNNPNNNPKIRKIPRGYFDVQGTGKPIDYCRYAGDYGNVFWSCALGGNKSSSDQYTKYDPNDKIFDPKWACALAGETEEYKYFERNTPDFSKFTTASNYEKFRLISKDGRCGPSGNNAECPEHQCCSEWGYCGYSFDNCKSNKNSKYNGENAVVISTDGKCGSSNGNTKCQTGECCSPYGYCGKTPEHCAENPNSKFNGNEFEISLDGRCGPNGDNKKCPPEECCSKWGYCGRKEDNCTEDRNKAYDGDNASILKLGIWESPKVNVQEKYPSFPLLKKYNYEPNYNGDIFYLTSFETPCLIHKFPSEAEPYHYMLGRINKNTFNDSCFVGYNDAEHSSKDFLLLHTNRRMAWKNSADVPDDKKIWGGSEVLGRSVRKNSICRLEWDGQWRPGRNPEGTTECIIGYGGNEVIGNTNSPFNKVQFLTYDEPGKETLTRKQEIWGCDFEDMIYGPEKGGCREKCPTGTKPLEGNLHFCL